MKTPVKIIDPFRVLVSESDGCNPLANLDLGGDAAPVVIGARDTKKAKRIAVTILPRGPHGSVLVIDPKGELAATAKVRRPKK